MPDMTRVSAFRVPPLTPQMCLAALIVPVLLAIYGAMPVAAAERVGEVTRIQKQADATTEGAIRELDTGSPVHLDDEVRTGAGARLEITLIDGTALTLGENATLVVDTFVFAAGQQNQLTATVEGAFRFVTGQVGAAVDNDIRIATPLATIGIRGTDFWGGPIDRQYGVFLIDGSVSVTTPQGEAVLVEPGTGVNLSGADAPPGPVTEWPQDKVNRAVSTVTFAQ